MKRKEKNVKAFPRNHPIQVAPDIEPPDFAPATKTNLEALYVELGRLGASPRCAGMLRSMGQLKPSARLAVNLKSAVTELLMCDGPDTRMGLTKTEINVLQELEGLAFDDEDVKLTAWGLFYLPYREAVVSALRDIVNKVRCQDRRWQHEHEKGTDNGNKDGSNEEGGRSHDAGRGVR